MASKRLGVVSEPLMLESVEILFENLSEPFSHDGKDESLKWSVTALLPINSPIHKKILSLYDKVKEQAEKDGKKLDEFGFIEEIKPVKGKETKGLGTHVKVRAHSSAWDHVNGVIANRPNIRDKYNNPMDEVPGYGSIAHIAIEARDYVFNDKKYGLSLWLQGLMVTELKTRNTQSLFAKYAANPADDFAEEMTSSSSETSDVADEVEESAPSAEKAAFV